MTLPGYLYRSGFRSARWIFLTCGTIAVSVFLLVTLLTAMRELTAPAESEASMLRVITRHKASLANLLPARYMDTVRKMPEAEIVMPWTWFGGVYVDESNFFARFSTDPYLFFTIAPECHIEPAQLEAWKKAKDGCIVGRKTFDKYKKMYGWELGKSIVLKGDIYPVDLELRIVGIYTGGVDETMLLFRDDYLQKLTGDRGQVGTMWIKARDAAAVEPLMKKVDAAFANSEAETKTETEKQFQLDFISMLGNIKALFLSICAVVVTVLLLVNASTVAMAIRERTREIAILKAVGFNAPLVFLMLVTECMIVAGIGGVVGVGLAKVLTSRFDVTEATQGFLLQFDITPGIMTFSLGVALATGLLSGIVPAYNAARLTVVQGLKPVE